jgi:hypothetical protein
MKKVLAIVSLIIAFCGFSAKAEEGQDVTFYLDLAQKLDAVKIYQAQDLTFDILENRNGRIIIETIIGEVLNDAGDGRIMNPAIPTQDYICYAGLEGVYPGDIILTYCIYNPDNNYTDDIMLRFDYIIDIGQEHYMAEKAAE